MNFKVQVHRVMRLGAIFLLAALVAPPGWADERDQAKRIHDRIAGVPPDETLLNTMATEIGNDNAVAAALMATDAPEFYSVTLKNWAAPWTNRDQSVFVPLDDYTATIIGMVRDDMDFRQILQANVIYTGSGGGIPAYNTNNNAHYEALEAQGVNLMANLTQSPQSSLTGVPATATAGVMTTRSAAKAFFIDGTNRAMFRFTMLNHLCNDMEQVKDITRVPDRIRQDVSRSPGGDSRVFLNNCIGCHTGMDPMAQSMAYYNYNYDVANDPDGQNGSITYNTANDIDPVTGTRVHAKYFNNNQNFEHGFITENEDWANYWRAGPNVLLGWDSALSGSGTGLKSMGQELAHSDAFAQCQVEKVFANVCLRPVQDDADRAQVASMVTSFRNSGPNGFNLKQVFAESAVYCMGD
ncbi:MAG: hypothetical protein OES38_09755 [Gammaproteobacteria bacterium]|nr:hypothetical protein [Gammaproteobacteria bacterium]